MLCTTLFYAGIYRRHTSKWSFAVSFHSWLSVDGRYAHVCTCTSFRWNSSFFILLFLSPSFSLYVLLFVCLFFVCLFRFRLREENRFLWHLSTSLLRDPTKLFQCSFFSSFLFFSLSLVLRSRVLFLTLNSIAYKHKDTQKGRCSTNQKSWNEQQIVNCWNEQKKIRKRKNTTLRITKKQFYGNFYARCCCC